MLYYNCVKQLAMTVKSMVKVDDMNRAMAILNELPQTFEHLIVALEAIGADDQITTLNIVKSRLLQEEKRMGQQNVKSIRR